MALTTASNNTAIQNQQQLLPILRFWNDYGVSITEVSDAMYRVKTARAIDGFDTSRTYPTFDMAALAVIQHVYSSGLVTQAA